jgi:hypothetical protein
MGASDHTASQTTKGGRLPAALGGPRHSRILPACQQQPNLAGKAGKPRLEGAAALVVGTRSAGVWSRSDFDRLVALGVFVLLSAAAVFL